MSDHAAILRSEAKGWQPKAAQLMLDAADEIERLRADQLDWRKGVRLIASAAGLDHLSCVGIAERVLALSADSEQLRAEREEIERVKKAVQRDAYRMKHGRWPEEEPGA